MTDTTLSKKQLSHLRSLAHHLNPVVMIGNRGLTESVLTEIERNLVAHELIKIQVAGEDKAARTETYQKICEASQAQAVHHIGKQLVIYRASENKLISFPA